LENRQRLSRDACLLGIMSRKIQARPKGDDSKSVAQDLAKYFVPASSIRTFIPANYPF